MKKSGTVKHNSLPLSLKWEVTLTGISTQLGETGKPGELCAASNLIASAIVAADWAGKDAPNLTVAAGLINILMRDYKEVYFRHKGEYQPSGRILYKLNKPGPLWDPAEEALNRKTQVFPFSVPPEVIPLNGKAVQLAPFVDSPRIVFDKEDDGQEVLYVEGKSVFLIALSAVIQEKDEQDEVFLFTHHWIIDWRLRPLAFGWNSVGDPMAFETTTENAEDAIEKMSPDKTANETPATVIKTTWRA